MQLPLVNSLVWHRSLTEEVKNSLHVHNFNRSNAKIMRSAPPRRVTAIIRDFFSWVVSRFLPLRRSYAASLI